MSVSDFRQEDAEEPKSVLAHLIPCYLWQTHKSTRTVTINQHLRESSVLSHHIRVSSCSPQLDEYFLALKGFITLTLCERRRTKLEVTTQFHKKGSISFL